MIIYQRVKAEKTAASCSLGPVRGKPRQEGYFARLAGDDRLAVRCAGARPEIVKIKIGMTVLPEI